MTRMLFRFDVFFIGSASVLCDLNGSISGVFWSWGNIVLVCMSTIFSYQFFHSFFSVVSIVKCRCDFGPVGFFHEL